MPSNLLELEARLGAGEAELKENEARIRQGRCELHISGQELGREPDVECLKAPIVSIQLEIENNVCFLLVLNSNSVY